MNTAPAWKFRRLPLVPLMWLPGLLWGQANWQYAANVIHAPTGISIGIGTGTPHSALDIRGSVSVGNMLSFVDSSGTPYQDNWIGMVNWIEGTTKWLHIGGITDAGARRIALYADRTFFSGNVGIGTLTPQYRLAVNGTIGAREIIVTDTGWPDHVFRPGYRLMPLAEVATYIRKHGHLPEIPSEADVQEKGVGVGEMQAKLLAKIEELTLHMIQMEQENREIRKRLEQQNFRIAELEARAQ